MKVSTDGNPYFRGSPGMFNSLVKLIEQNPHGYHCLLRRPENKELLNWINDATPALSSKTYTVATKCNWIFHGVTEFPKCVHCGKLFTQNITIWKEYPRYCRRCNFLYNDERKRQVAAKNAENWKDPEFRAKTLARYNATAIKNNSVQKGIERTRQTRMSKYGGWHPGDFGDTVKNAKIAHGHAWNWNNREKSKETCAGKYGCEFASQSETVKRKIAGTNIERRGVVNPFQAEDVKRKIALTNLERLGVANPFQAEEVKAKIKRTVIERYGVEYPMQCKEIADRSKSKHKAICVERYGTTTYLTSQEFKDWCVRTYGVENVMQCPEIMTCARKKIKYEETYFDSRPELAYFVWLTDHGIDFQYKSGFFYEYAGPDSKMRRYFPDFIVEGVAVEIKGDQFFKEDGTMQNPFDHSQDALYEAKHQCMLVNGVVILRRSRYKEFEDYVARKYGKDFLDKFKTQRED